MFCPTPRSWTRLADLFMSAKAENMQFDIPQYMQSVGKRARLAARAMGRADSGMKDAALTAIAAAI